MDVREILRKYDIRPSKFKSQHFLLDGNVLVRNADVSERDTILEIGAGLGNLTRLLAQKAKKVIAVEKDPRFCEILRGLDLKNVEIIEREALGMKFPKFNKIVSNLPFGISSQITFKLFEYKWDEAVLIYQKEFAERFLAKPGDKNYSRLSVGVQYYCDVEVLEILPKDRFYPRSKVDSAIVKLKQRRVKMKGKEFFWSIVKACFQHKRKKVRNALVDSAHVVDIEREKLKKIKESLFEKKVFLCSIKDFEKIEKILRSDKN